MNKNGLILPKFTNTDEIDNYQDYTEDNEPLEPEEQDREYELDYLAYDNEKRENHISEDLEYEDNLQKLEEYDDEIQEHYINKKNFNF